MRSWQTNHPDVTIVDLPSKAQDINPIMKIWELFKAELQYGPRNIERQKERVIDCWLGLKDDSGYYTDMFLGIKQTMEEIIENHGGFVM